MAPTVLLCSDLLTFLIDLSSHKSFQISVTISQCIFVDVCQEKRESMLANSVLCLFLEFGGRNFKKLHSK